MTPQICPLCGKPVEDEKKIFCADCRSLKDQYSLFSNESSSAPTPPDRETIENATPIAVVDKNDDAPLQESEPTATINTKPKRQKKHWLIILTTLVVLALAAGVYFVTDNYYQNEHDELALWNKELSVNTGKAYMEYIHCYPDGKHIVEAQKYILQYNDRIRKQWNNIRQKAIETDIISFLSSNQGTPYQKEAETLLDSVAWINVSKTNTEESYKSYLDRATRKELIGTYKSIAEEKYNYFAQMEFVGGKEWSRTEDEVLRFFQLLSSKNYAALEPMFAQTVNVFYNLKDTNPRDIVSSIQKQMTNGNISSMQIVADTSQIRIQKDAKGFFIINLPAQKILALKNKENKTQENVLFDIMLDSSFNIVELKESKNQK